MVSISKTENVTLQLPRKAGGRRWIGIPRARVESAPPRERDPRRARAPPERPRRAPEKPTRTGLGGEKCMRAFRAGARARFGLAGDGLIKNHTGGPNGHFWGFDLETLNPTLN